MAPLTEKNNNAIITPSTKADKTSKVTKKRASTDSATTKSKPTSTKSKDAPAKKTTKADDLTLWDVTGITLPGEDKHSVPVYDTCNDLRTKINTYTKNAPKKINSKAAFCRKISEAAATPEPVSVVSLNTFMKKSGPVAGANSPVCYAAYVYFEKVRVLQGKAKSKKREEMEGVHGREGMRLHDPSTQGLWVHSSQTVTVDKFGKIEIVKRR